MMQCTACGKFMSVKDGVSCPQCNSKSHYECVRIPVGATVSSTWRCGECQVRTPKGRDPATPVRGIVDSYSVEEIRQKTNEPMLLDDTAHDITAEFTEMEQQLDMKSLRDEMSSGFRKFEQLFLTEFRSMKEDVASMMSDMRDIKKEIADVRQTLNGCMDRTDRIEEQVQGITARSDRIEERVSTLENTIVELKGQLNDRDQDALANDVELTGVPEVKGENPVHLVTVLAVTLGVNLDMRDVVSAERVGAPRKTQGASQVDGRPRSIVIRFSRRAVRDEYLQAARVRRGLTSADLGVEGTPQRIFINERLSPSNRRLFAKTREACRSHEWRYSWTKGGRIFMRRQHGSPLFRVRSENDLERCFGKRSV